MSHWVLVYNFLVQHKDFIIIITSIIVAGVAGFGIYSLILHYKALRLQRDNLQASLFSEISKRINELLDNEPGQNKKAELENWYIRLYNSFEFLAFFANRSYLDNEMKSYYVSFIDGYNKRIVSECPSAIEWFTKDAPTDLFKELRRFSKSLPF